MRRLTNLLIYIRKKKGSSQKSEADGLYFLIKFLLGTKSETLKTMEENGAPEEIGFARHYFVYLFTHTAEKRADALSMGL